MIRLNYGTTGYMLDQGTQDFYLAYSVDVADTSPKLYYGSGSGKLFFMISAEAGADNGKEQYQPVTPANPFKMDLSMPKGSLNNPLLREESLTKSNYSF